MSCNGRLFRNTIFTVAAFLLAIAVAYGQTPAKTPEFVPGSWTLVLLPDTQYYSEKYPGLFTLQTHWIAKNKDKYNIRYVLSLGDITETNSDMEWRRAQEAIGELDGKVPYTLLTGNHDYTPLNNSILGTTGLNQYFPASKFREWPTFGGTMKADDIQNSYHLFSAGGSDWIVIALEWLPSDEAVQWANGILAKYPQRKAILTTHAYLTANSTRWDASIKLKPKPAPAQPKADTPTEQADGGKKKNSSEKSAKIPGLIAAFHVNDGEGLWQKLVRKNNFVFTLNGHFFGVGFLSSKNDAGKMTHQMLVDYQDCKLGGEGYLRILEFLPDGKTVHVKSYSPLYDKYLEDAGNQFNIEIDR